MTIVLGALILLAGILIGRFLPARRRAPRIAAPPQPVCGGCNHHLSFHDPATGVCHGTVKQAAQYSPGGNAVVWDQVPCTCRKYSGPEPIDGYFATEISA
jgi:hypothetical protein